MSLKQLSTFLENTPGRVAEVTKLLGEANININALVLSDTIDFGILRLIVDDTEKAYRILKENEFIVRLTDVIIVPISHYTGSLAKILEVLGDVSIEYMYAFLGREDGEAFVAFKMEDLDEAKKVLKKHNIKSLNENELTRNID